MILTRTPYRVSFFGGGTDLPIWFKEHGGLTRKNGDHFRKTLLSRGGTLDAMQMYRNFSGRDAQVQPLLERRGLTGQ